MTGYHLTTTIAALTLSISAHASDLTQQDKAWLRRASQADMAEISLGQIAENRAQDQVTKDLAKYLITDHDQDLRDVRELATSESLQLPKYPNPHQWRALEILKQAWWPNWDERYIVQEIRSHKVNIEAAQKEISSGTDIAVVNRATMALTMLKEHLKRCQEAYEQLPIP